MSSRSDHSWRAPLRVRGPGYRGAMSRALAEHRGALVVLAVVALVASACGGGGDSDSIDPAAFVPTEIADDCLLVLHGKGGDGAVPSTDADGVLTIAPRGNAEGWDGHQWDYRTDDTYADARAIVLNALNRAQCLRVVVHGFSNGAAMAAALACDPVFRNGPVVGYVVDDPVTDDVPIGCVPDPDADLVVYWTGALPDVAAPGTACAEVDWTCLGDTVRSIDAYAADLGVGWQPSIHADHRRYDDPPEFARWFS